MVETEAGVRIGDWFWTSLELSSDTANVSSFEGEESAVVEVVASLTSSRDDWDQRRAVAMTGANTTLVRREA